MIGNGRMGRPVFGQVRRQQGSTLVEFAFVLVFVLTLLFAIIDFGRMLYVYHFVGNEAREGARWASVRSNYSSLGPADSGPLQTLVTNVTGMGLDRTKITSSINWITPPNGAGNCANNNVPGCSVQVTVNYDYTPLFPAAFLPKNSFRMSSTSEMVITQ